MQKKTWFVIIFFFISFGVLFMYEHADPVPSADRFHLPEPRVIDINGVNFTVSWGFQEDKNSSDMTYSSVVLNHNITKQQRIFHQNDILLLNITVYDVGEALDISLFNDGTYHAKSINGVDGIFKNESVTVQTGPVKNTHQRYYFDYAKGENIVMIQCDKLDALNQIVS